MIGKRIRLNSLLRKDGRSVIIAMDHGSISGPSNGFVSPRDTLQKVISGKPDAILTTRGVILEGWDLLDYDVGILLRISGGFTTLGGRFEETIVSSVEHSLRLGAQGVAVTVKYGHEREDEFIRQASLIADECYRWGMALMTEVWPAGKRVSQANDPAAVKLGARAAADFGTDIVKTFYTDSEESFAEVTEGCPVPVVVLGGAKTESVLETFQMVEKAMAAGAAGVAMGRNVWGHPNPTRIIQALNGIVHEGWSATQAYGFLNK